MKKTAQKAFAAYGAAYEYGERVTWALLIVFGTVIAVVQFWRSF